MTHPNLTRREQEILTYLASHKPRWIPTDELIDAVWEGFASAATVRSAVREIRGKLPEGALVSRANFGYRLEDPQFLYCDGCYRPMAEYIPALRCQRCLRQVVKYEDGWTCYGCGMAGGTGDQRPRKLGFAHQRLISTRVLKAERAGKAWTPTELDTLRNLAAKRPTREIAADLGRSQKGVQTMLNTLGIVRPRRLRAGSRVAE